MNYRSVLDELGREGVRFAVLRGYRRLADGADGPDDLDLLVSPRDLDRFRSLLLDRGFWIWEYSQPHQEMWTTLTLPGLRSMTLDRKPSLFPAGLRLEAPPVDQVLDRAREGAPGIPVTHPTHEFWALYTHVAVGRSPEERRGYLPRFRDLLDTGRVERMEMPLGPDEAMELLFEPREAIFRALGAGYREPEAVRIRRRGLTVALVGPDGSGKTTLVELLGRVLPYTTRIYMGLRDFVLPTTRFFYRRAGGDDGHLGQASGHAADPAAERGVDAPGAGREAAWAPGPGEAGAGDAGRPWTTRIRYGIYMLNHHLEFLARYLRGLVRKLRGRIVLFDRYYYDVMGLPRDSFEAGLRPRLLELFPRPDLLVLLRPPVEVMTARKDERSEAYYRRFYDAYDGLLERLGPRPEVLTLDTSGDPEAAARAVAIRVQRMRQWQSLDDLP